MARASSSARRSSSLRSRGLSILPFPSRAHKQAVKRSLTVAARKLQTWQQISRIERPCVAQASSLHNAKFQSQGTLNTGKMPAPALRSTTCLQIERLCIRYVAGKPGGFPLQLPGTALSSNGRTPDSDSGYSGSNPDGATNPHHEEQSAINSDSTSQTGKLDGKQ
jgi:hypothetical protein